MKGVLVFQELENMNYKLIKMYTERLDISSFHQLVNGDEIKLGVNFNTSLLPSENENILIFKIDYSIRSMYMPISLNWVGICILEFNEAPINKIESDIFLENEDIKNFIDDSIEHCSFFIGGDLPKLEYIKGKKEND